MMMSGTGSQIHLSSRTGPESHELGDVPPTEFLIPRIPT